MSRRPNTVVIVLALTTALSLAGAASAQVPPPDYSGNWALSSSAILPNDGGTCMFEGMATIMQNGTDLVGNATLMLVDGPAACPMEMMADLSGQVGAGGCVELGLLLGGQLGEAAFTGCPENGPDSLGGRVSVESGPFVGTVGDWSALRVRPSVLEIPTLSALGLTGFVMILLVAGALLLRGHSIA